MQSVTLSHKSMIESKKIKNWEPLPATSILLRLPSTRMQWPVLTIANSNDRSSRSGVLCRAKKSKTSLRESSYIGIPSYPRRAISFLCFQFFACSALSRFPRCRCRWLWNSPPNSPWIIANRKQKYREQGKWSDWPECSCKTRGMLRDIPHTIESRFLRILIE